MQSLRFVSDSLYCKSSIQPPLVQASLSSKFPQIIHFCNKPLSLSSPQILVNQKRHGIKAKYLAKKPPHLRISFSSFVCFIVDSFLSSSELSLSNSLLNVDNAEYVPGTSSPPSRILGPFGEKAVKQLLQLRSFHTRNDNFIGTWQTSLSSDLLSRCIKAKSQWWFLKT